MVVSRASHLVRGLGRTVSRRTTSAGQSRSWKQLGRRTYASGHGEQETSELPWIIGSIAVTVPAAGWLLQQGPSKSDHGHGSHGAEHKEESAETEEKEESEEQKDEPEEKPATEESEDDSKDEKSEDGQEEKASSKESEDKEDSGAEEKGTDYPPPSPGSPGQINWHSGMKKGPGEGQKGERKPSERKGEKDSQGSQSGAQHPYLDDAEKSKKGSGPTETAKIHGTVDSNAPLRGTGNKKDDE